MKYVIYGGTFNPPHLEHIAIARHALLSGYDRVVLLPSATVTTADGTAYDIHPSDGRAYLPVGILTSAADTLTFSFETAGNADLADYELYDNVTGTAYPLDNELTFSNMGTSVGRFALRDRRAL